MRSCSTFRWCQERKKKLLARVSRAVNQKRRIVCWGQCSSETSDRSAKFGLQQDVRFRRRRRKKALASTPQRFADLSPRPAPHAETGPMRPADIAALDVGRPARPGDQMDARGCGRRCGRRRRDSPPGGPRCCGPRPPRCGAAAGSPGGSACRGRNGRRASRSPRSPSGRDRRRRPRRGRWRCGSRCPASRALSARPRLEGYAGRQAVRVQVAPHGLRQLAQARQPLQGGAELGRRGDAQANSSTKAVSGRRGRISSGDARREAASAAIAPGSRRPPPSPAGRRRGCWLARCSRASRPAAARR